MAKVFIGVDPHKLSATIEVVDHRERVLATGRFKTDKAGYAAMRQRVAGWPERVWAVEGSNGAGRPPRGADPAPCPDRQPVAAAAVRAHSGEVEEGHHHRSGQGDPRFGAAPGPGREDPTAARRRAPHRARILADVGDVARFADRNRFASWTGTAPLDAPSGEQIRHRLSRAGNRKINHMLHIAAATQTRLNTPGRAYYRRKQTAGKTRMEAMRCLKRRISDAVYRRLPADARAAAHEDAGMGPGGHCGASQESSAVDLPRTSTLRISHFPDPQHRRYNRPAEPERPRFSRPVDNRGKPERLGSECSGWRRTLTGSRTRECP